MPKQITMGWILIHPKDFNVLQIHPTSVGMYRMRRDISDATIFETCAASFDFRKTFVEGNSDIFSARVYIEIPD